MCRACRATGFSRKPERCPCRGNEFGYSSESRSVEHRYGARIVGPHESERIVYAASPSMAARSLVLDMYKRQGRAFRSTCGEHVHELWRVVVWGGPWCKLDESKPGLWYFDVQVDTSVQVDVRPVAER
jgi:hypothetical protein